MMTTEPSVPKVFISYCWTSDDHKDWVRNLADRLIAHGVEVIIDQYDLIEGHDVYAFMERSVADSAVNKVLIICEKGYTGKANSRKGGVGVESTIISEKVYKSMEQTKFIPILAERNETGEAALPVFLASRKYIDFSSIDNYNRNYEQLIRALYEQPLLKKPPLGLRPEFLLKANAVPTKTGELFRQAHEELQRRESTSYRLFVRKYIDGFVQELTEFGTTSTASDASPEDYVLTSINDFLPNRDELVTILQLYCAKSENDADFELIVDMLQRIGALKFMRPLPSNQHRFSAYTREIHEFLAYEIFLYAVVALLKHGRFSMVNHIAAVDYYIGYNDYTRNVKFLKFIELFECYPDSLEVRHKHRLNPQPISVVANLIKDRITHPGVSVDDLALVDYILVLISILSLPDYWRPKPLMFAPRGQTFKLFDMAQSRRYFDPVKLILNIRNKDELLQKYREGLERIGGPLKNGTFSFNNYGMNTHNLAMLGGLESLDTRP